MAKDDFAIVTGICWYPNPGFSNLQGPPNDIELVKRWLIDKAGLDPINIKTVATPSPQPVIEPDIAPPLGQDFDLVFKRMMVKRLAMGKERVKGRLYLYFSGHGFCNRSQDRPAEAALYCANTTKEMYEHIFGTHYARVAVGQALFKEVVLIMDCCRDSELSRAPMPRPYRDTPDDGLAADVQLLAIYAVPKGGKAQERSIPERGGAVHGLLTHAIFKLLEELPSDAGGIPSTRLKERLAESWDSVCGVDAAPRPDVFVPSNGEIHFPTEDKGSPMQFAWTLPVASGATLTLVNNEFQDVATFILDGAANPIMPAQSPVLHYEHGAQTLRLRMRPGIYQYKLSQPAKQDVFKVDGGDRRVDL